MLLSVEPDGPVPIYQQIRGRIVEAIADGQLPTGSGLLRQEGLLRIGRKSGTVVQRDAASGPPRPGWEQDWAGRLRTLLAEATAQGLPADDIIRHCQAALAGFAFPAAPAEADATAGARS